MITTTLPADRLAALLQTILERTSGAVGREFFSALTATLADTFNVRYAAIGRLQPDEQVRTLALWANGAPAANISYPLCGTPCARVIGQSPQYYPEEVIDLFPEDTLLRELGVTCYLGVPLMAAQGEPLGNLLLMNDKPLDTQLVELALRLMELLALRTSAEIQRLEREEALGQRLRESEHRYQIFSELTADFFHTCLRDGDEPFRVQWVGGKYEQLTGQPVDQLLAAGCWLPLVHPDDQARVSAALQLATAGTRTNIEFRLVRPDGSVRWIEESCLCEACSSVPGRIIRYGACRDITATRAASQALQTAENAYRTIFNSANDTIFVLNVGSGMIVDCNQRAIEMFRRSRQELIGATPLDLTPADDETSTAELAATLIAAAESGTPQLFEWRCLAGDGSIFWGEVNLRATEINGRTRLLALVRDISERKQLEQQFTQAQQAAEQANRSKSEFLANMSHEVRTPLNGIMGMSQLLRMAGVTDEQAGYLNMLDDSCAILLTLINDILDISRIEAGRMVIEEVPFNLPAVLEQTLQLHQQTAEGKGLALVLMLEQGVPASLQGDPLRLKQILLNLVGNALKFTASGSVTLSVAVTEPNSPTARLCLTVSDTGIGIPREALCQIFDHFTQADASTTRLYGGSGLGLTICRRLTELMGGRIWAESTLGSGSSFHVELPLRPALAAPLESAASPTDIPATPPLRILLVEDQTVNRSFATALLIRQGHQISGAASGNEALELLRCTSFDLALVDIELPDMDGRELLTRLRCLSGCEELPVIAMTAHALPEDRTRFLSAGFGGYCPKPLDIPQLLREIGRAYAVCTAKKHSKETCA